MRIMEERSSVFAYGGLAAYAAAGLGAVGLVLVLVALSLIAEPTLFRKLVVIVDAVMFACLMMTAWALSILGEPRSAPAARSLLAVGLIGMIGEIAYSVLVLPEIVSMGQVVNLLNGVGTGLIGVWLVGGNLLARRASGASGPMVFVGIFTGVLCIIYASSLIAFPPGSQGDSSLPLTILGIAYYVLGLHIGLPLWAAWLGRGLITGRIRPVN